MSSKTPFEIRTELLNIAQGLLFERMNTERTRLEMDWNTKREIFFQAMSRHDMAPTEPIPAFPDMPIVTTEDVIAEAKKLNDFVSKG
jgi:hypothetical protein